MFIGTIRIFPRSSKFAGDWYPLIKGNPNSIFLTDSTLFEISMTILKFCVIDLFKSIHFAIKKRISLLSTNFYCLYQSNLIFCAPCIMCMEQTFVNRFKEVQKYEIEFLKLIIIESKALSQTQLKKDWTKSGVNFLYNNLLFTSNY